MEASAHLQVAREFMSASESYSVAGAPLIKSEMLWCAAAHSAKAAANQYGWTNVSHDDLFRVVERLARRLSETRLNAEFKAASNLHKNMYEGQMNARQLTRADATVRRFVNRVAAILAAYPRLSRRRQTQGR